MARSKVNYDEALRLSALPLAVTGDNASPILSVALPRIIDPETVSALQFISGMQIRPIVVSDEVLPEAIYLAYKGDPELLEERTAALNKEIIKALPSRGLVEFRRGEGSSAQFLEALVDYALSTDASDIHLIPKRDGCHLRLRKDGELLSREAPCCSLEQYQRLVTRIKVVAGLDTTKRTAPQDGAFSLERTGKGASVRVSTLPTVCGEKMVLRLHRGQRITSIDELGFPSPARSILTDFIASTQGLLLFSGPTGSGKTTCMYSIVHHLAQENVSIVSIENPVESELPEVSQTQVNEEMGLTYSVCLKAALRQDPDVILIGEIRDEETARTVLHASLTGHRIISTIHGGNVSEARLRLTKLGVHAEELQTIVRGIFSQRLVPSLCPKCAVFDLAATRRFGFEVLRENGCGECDYTGFTERVLLVEGEGGGGKISFRDSLLELLRGRRISSQQFEHYLLTIAYDKASPSTQRMHDYPQ